MHPEYDQAEFLTQIGLKVLGIMETSAQEAACYLLRQSMSWASRATVAIPTVSPHGKRDQIIFFFDHYFQIKEIKPL